MQARETCLVDRPDGTYLCLKINRADTLKGNLGLDDTVFHGFSLLLCMTTSLASGGLVAALLAYRSRARKPCPATRCW
jgi:hypothetical protein